MDDDRHAVAVGGTEHAAYLLQVRGVVVIHRGVPQVQLEPVAEVGFLTQP